MFKHSLLLVLVITLVLELHSPQPVFPDGDAPLFAPFARLTDSTCPPEVVANACSREISKLHRKFLKLTLPQKVRFLKRYPQACCPFRKYAECAEWAMSKVDACAEEHVTATVTARQVLKLAKCKLNSC